MIEQEVMENPVLDAGEVISKIDSLDSQDYLNLKQNELNYYSM